MNIAGGDKQKAIDDTYANCLFLGKTVNVNL